MSSHSASLSARQRQAISAVAARSFGSPVDRTLRICLHFHPDRLHGDTTILRAMAADGVYRSQFETRTSNGGLTAHVGGDRWAWESRIFSGAYDDAHPSDRPKYGALNFRKRRSGPSPRFGSCYFRLAEHALDRATFCYPDSYFDPNDFGTADRMGLIPLAEKGTPDPLDNYIEAHIHSEVRLQSDVEALVLDPCYAETDVERQARALPCPVEFHSGYVLDIPTLEANPDYRGPQYVAVGRTLARNGMLTPAILGDAARAGLYDPQSIKKLWHILARFGDRSETSDV